MGSCTIGDVVADKILEFIGKGNLKSVWQLHTITLVPFGTLKSIMQRRVNDVKLKTVIQIAEGLGMSVAEFLDDARFSVEYLDL